MRRCRFTFVLIMAFILGRGSVLFAETRPLWETLPDAQQLAKAVEGAPANAHVAILNTPDMRRVAASINAIPQSISVPSPDGGYEAFRVVQTEVFHPELSRKFPDFRSFKGKSESRPGVTARFDYSENGFHGQIFEPGGVSYIMPWEAMGDDAHASFSRSAMGAARHGLRCRVRGDGVELEPRALPGADPIPQALANVKTYRIAIATTAEFSAFHGGTVSNVLAKVGTLLNMLNGIYERDVGATFRLVGNNDQLIFLNPSTDPYPGNNEGADPILGALDANMPTIHNAIGNANYDIGHLFMRYPSFTGEGAATFGSACQSSALKADGGSVDIGGGSPEGMVFVADVFAHEVGHQFSAHHSYNSTTDGCAGQRSGGAAYEIGGGQSIMAYGGACFPNNVVINNLPFFNHHSIAQIRGRMAACGASAVTNNNIPTVSAGPDVTIPINTPFELTAQAGDTDGDTLSFSWEQHDSGPAQGMNGPDNGQSPLFRLYAPSTSATRRFPTLGNLPSALPDGEVMPVMARSMDFQVVVRDGNTGGSAIDAMVATVTTSAGPFRVTSQSAAGITYTNYMTVTWDVANTHLPPVNCTNVDIYLVQGNGAAIGDEIQLLAQDTPNDGSHDVLLPPGPLSSVRIKVKGSDNIFYDANEANFALAFRAPIVDMEIASIQGPTNVTPGTNVAMYVTLRNNGPETVASGEFVFDWPDAWQNTSPDFTIFGELPSGAATTLCFMAQLTSPHLQVTDAFLDIVLFGDTDTNLANNTFDRPFVLVQGADVSIIRMENSPAQVQGGSAFMTHVVVSNAGPLTARSTLVTLTVPASLQAQGSVTNPLGDLAVGDVRVADFMLLPGLAANSALTLTAVANSVDPDPQFDNNTTHLVFTPNREAQTVYNGCFALLDDGGFEHGNPWPAWPVSTSQTYSNGVLCGCGVEAVGAPATGSNWVWFSQEGAGGEVARLGRDVLFPDGTGQLSFDLWIAQVAAPFTDVMTVSLDSNILVTLNEPAAVEPGYSNRTVDVSAFCDGTMHTLAFDFVSPGGGGLSSFNLDNVQIDVCMDQADGDGDGVPDAWERRHSLNTNDVFDVLADDDGDGENNFREWVSGTDPNDSNSVFRVSGHLVPVGNGNLNCVSIDSAPGRRYQLHYRDGMESPLWNSIPASQKMGNGRTLTLKDPVVVSNRVYRVQVDIP